MSRAIIVGNDKGGVGKTPLAVHTVTYLTGLGLAFRPVDWDKTVPSLISKIFPTSSSINPDLSRRHTGNWNVPAFFDQRILQNQNVVIDCGANTMDAWRVLFGEVRPGLRKELHDAGVKVTVIVPFDGHPKSVASFEEIREIFDFATIILALVRDRAHLTNVPSHASELTINVPIAPDIVYARFRDQEKSFDEIARDPDPKGRFLAGIAQRYLARFHAELQRIQPHLEP